MPVESSQTIPDLLNLGPAPSDTPNLVSDHTFHFMNGFILTFTINEKAGDSISIKGSTLTAKLSPKENPLTGEEMPGETNVVNLSHVLVRQVVERPAFAPLAKGDDLFASFDAEGAIAH